LYNSATGVAKNITGISGDKADYVYSIYPEQGIFTVSHPTNGTITAYDLQDMKQAWRFTPKPILNDGAHIEPKASEENNLFKVLIKQGSENVTRSYYDQETNQLLLIKNSDKLVTVDADAKCAIRWEQFYSGDGKANN